MRTSTSSGCTVRRVIRLLAAIGFAIAPGIVIAEEDATLFPVPDYSGDWMERPRATGDWGGYRQSLAEKGVQFELDFVQTVQGITSGGLGNDTDYTGTLDYVLKLDVQKLGLWPGAFIMVRAETLFGETVAFSTGSLMATSIDSIVPAPTRKTPISPISISSSSCTRWWGSCWDGSAHWTGIRMNLPTVAERISFSISPWSQIPFRCVRFRILRSVWG